MPVVASHAMIIASPSLKMDKLSRNVQHHLATFTTEGGQKVRRGNRFLGRERDIRDDQNKCVCGICVRTRNIPREKCTLFRDGDLKLVQRQQTELCKPVCMSRSPTRMLGRLIKHMLLGVSKHAISPVGRLFLTLQRDDSVELSARPMSTHPYLFKATYLGGEDPELELLFFTTIDNDRDNFEPYRLGDPINIDSYVRNPNAQVRFRSLLERALIEGDGKHYSLVVVCPELPERDFEVSGIQFKYVDNYAFRAWPLFLFTQAAPGE